MLNGNLRCTMNSNLLRMTHHTCVHVWGEVRVTEWASTTFKEGNMCAGHQHSRSPTATHRGRAPNPGPYLVLALTQQPGAVATVRRGHYRHAVTRWQLAPQLCLTQNGQVTCEGAAESVNMSAKGCVAHMEAEAFIARHMCVCAKSGTKQKREACMCVHVCACVCMCVCGVCVAWRGMST